MQKYTVSYYVMKFHRDFGCKIVYNWRERKTEHIINKIREKIIWEGEVLE